jgi:acyl-homoserine-lactone acylase
MATELTPQGPVTRTILTYSESANPRSPHYRGQTILFARKQWVTERFTQAQINAGPPPANHHPAQLAPIGLTP